MTLSTKQAQELDRAAKRDYKTFLILRESGRLFETTLFHAQQALEKILKAALVEQGVVFRRTHDLVELANLATAHRIDPPVAMELLIRLGPYAVEFRDPRGYSPRVARGGRNGSGGHDGLAESGLVFIIGRWHEKRGPKAPAMTRPRCFSLLVT